MGRNRISPAEYEGVTFGKLTILRRIMPPPSVSSKSTAVYVAGVCECGNQVISVLNRLKSGDDSCCPDCAGRRRKSIVSGNTYGRWAVISNIGKEKWLCRCNVCGTEKMMEKHGVERLRKSKDCDSCKNKKHSSAVKTVLWSHINRGAQMRGIEISITKPDIFSALEEQENKCALSGISIRIALSHKEHRAGKTTASLDRIDSSKGYTKENVQWVHKDINIIKQSYTDEYFISMCKAVAAHNSPSEDYIAY